MQMDTWVSMIYFLNSYDNVLNNCIVEKSLYFKIIRRTLYDFGKKIIFSDEAHFDLGGYLSKQNCRIWDTENPHAYIKKPAHPKWITVWCGFCSRGIIGPFFVQNE